METAPAEAARKVQPEASRLEVEQTSPDFWSEQANEGLSLEAQQVRLSRRHCGGVVVTVLAALAQMERGVFGVPSYLVGDALSWGAERIGRVRELLGD